MMMEMAMARSWVSTRGRTASSELARPEEEQQRPEEPQAGGRVSQL